jgi:hypothetical protein
MSRPVTQALWNQWRRRIERQTVSGRSIAEFCRREKVSPPAFYAWKRKLRDAASGGDGSGKDFAAERSRSKSPAVGTRRPAGGAPVGPLFSTRPGEFLQLPVTATPLSPWIELTLVDGTIIRIPQQNLEALVAVLRVLGGDRREVVVAEDCHA